MTNGLFNHAIVLTDSVNLLQKVESGIGRPDWHTAMHSLRLQRLLWTYCPSHASVKGTEQVDRLASTADITTGLLLGRAEVLFEVEELSDHIQERASQHQLPKGKKRGERKWPMFYFLKKGKGGGGRQPVYNHSIIGTVWRGDC